jgi:hypothetical protein
VRRLLAAIAAISLLALPATAATPAPVTPPAGAVVVAIGLSDGMALLPVASGVLPLVCAPAEVDR